MEETDAIYVAAVLTIAHVRLPPAEGPVNRTLLEDYLAQLYTRGLKEIYAAKGDPTELGLICRSLLDDVTQTGRIESIAGSEYETDLAVVAQVLRTAAEKLSPF